MRIWLEKKVMVFYNYGPLNPALELNIREFDHSELERFKKWLHEQSLKPGFPDGTEIVGIFDITDRKTVNAALASCRIAVGRFAPTPDFFRALRMIDGLEIRYTFEEGGGPWLVVCQLKAGISWKESRQLLL